MQSVNVHGSFKHDLKKAVFDEIESQVKQRIQRANQSLRSLECPVHGFASNFYASLIRSGENFSVRIEGCCPDGEALAGEHIRSIIE